MYKLNMIDIYMGIRAMHNIEVSLSNALIIGKDNQSDTETTQWNNSSEPFIT